MTMAGKSFKGGMDSLLGETGAKRGRPRTIIKEVTKTSQLGTKKNETRATFIVDEDQLEKIKALAFWDRTSIKEILRDALEGYIDGKKKDLPKALEEYKARNEGKGV